MSVLADDIKEAKRLIIRLVIAWRKAEIERLREERRRIRREIENFNNQLKTDRRNLHALRYQT